VPELQISFQLIIRSRFRFLTPDDGFLNFPCLKKKAGYGHEVQAGKNYRQRGYGRFLDTDLSNHGKGSIGLRIC
jgi:hypothetical protein